MVSPTISGTTIDARDHVRIIPPPSASVHLDLLQKFLFHKRSFFNERARRSSNYFFGRQQTMSAGVVRIIILTFLLAPRCDMYLLLLPFERVLPPLASTPHETPDAARGLFFPRPAVRVIAGIHNRSADRRADSHPPLPPSFSVRYQVVLFIANLPTSPALKIEQPHFSDGILTCA